MASLSAELTYSSTRPTMNGPPKVGLTTSLTTLQGRFGINRFGIIVQPQPGKPHARWSGRATSPSPFPYAPFAQEAERGLRAEQLVAIIHPDNMASRRVAEKIGMSHFEDDRGGAIAVRTVLGIDFKAP